MSAADELPAKLAAIRRSPGGGALSETSYDLDKVYEFISTRTTSQNGGEGVTPSDFDASLLKGLKYFGNRLCPFANRAYWSLEEKGLLGDGEISYVHVNLGSSKPAWYKDHVYYKGTVPAFVEDGAVVGESAIVAEFLDERFPGRGIALLPESPLQRAAIRFVVKTFDGGISALYGVLMNKDPALDNEKTEAALKLLREINDAFVRASPEGPYFLGETLSLADIAIVPFLARFSILLPFYRGIDLLKLGGDSVSRLADTLAASSQRPAFKRAFPPAEFLLASYYEYAGGTF